MMRTWWLVILSLLLSAPLHGQNKKKQSPLDQYLAQARQASAAPQPAANPSLFSVSSPNAFLFVDVKARNVNDVITIQILESSTASNTANTQASKEGDVSVQAPSVLGLERGLQALNFSNILEGGSSSNFQGQGTTTRSGTLQASISARVTEVLPNGDLAIEGTKQVTVNQERQILTLRGVVRSRDVSSGNVVLSTSIAFMEVELNGRGIVADANRPALLYRILKKILPF